MKRNGEALTIVDTKYPFLLMESKGNGADCQEAFAARLRRCLGKDHP
jgi:hypothetical protein